MAVVLTSEFTSNQDIDYKVEIIDTSAGSPLANTFKVQDVNIGYSTDTDNILTPVIPSTCEVLCWNEGGYFNSTFIPALIQNQQERFQVKVYQDTGSGYSLWWFGWVLQDQVEEVEASQPRQFVLKCADGLGRMQDKDYLDNNITGGVPPRTLFVTLITKLLSYTGLASLFSAADDYLVTSCNWFEDTMTYGATTDPLILSYIDTDIFRIKGEDGSEVQYTSAFDVLVQIAKLWNCRIYQSEGLWRFEQYGQRDSTTLKENVYRQNGTTQNSSTSSATYEKAIGTNTSLTSARSRGNNEAFLPAAKKIQLTYDQAFLTSEIGQFDFTSAGATAVNIGLVEGLPNTGLAVILDYFAIADGIAVSDRTKNHKVIFKIALTLETQGGTTYYYTNSNGGEWATSSATYEFESEKVNPNLGASVRFAGSYSLLTEPLPADGYLTLRIYLDDFYDYHKLVGAGWLPTTLSNEGWSAYSTLELDGEDKNVKATIYKSANSRTEIGDDETIDLGTLNIGDSVFNTGRIIINNAGTYEGTSNWREGNTGTYTSILQLLCNEALAYYDQPINIYDGDLYYSNSFQYRVNWDSQFYIPMDVSFSCNEGIWSGRWWQIYRDKTNISAETKYEKRRRLFRKRRANANEGDLPNGVLGGVQMTEGDGQISGVVDYEITPALMVTGVSGATIVPAGGADTYIVVTKVVIIKTDGTIDYGSGNASIYFASETTDVISAGGLLTAINTGLTKQFNPTDEAKFFANEDLLISIGSDASGDYDFTIKVYYKLISL